jgi:hypothetical protein
VHQAKPSSACLSPKDFGFIHLNYLALAQTGVLCNTDGVKAATFLPRGRELPDDFESKLDPIRRDSDCVKITSPALPIGVPAESRIFP